MSPHISCGTGGRGGRRDCTGKRVICIMCGSVSSLDRVLLLFHKVLSVSVVIFPVVKGHIRLLRSSRFVKDS